jgi:ABC-type nitrate/sulfonate/bicarbonate transport system substrate-binding protein
VIAATLRGFQYVSTHPEQAVEISKQYIPGQKIQLLPTAITTYRRERMSESTQRCHIQECYLVSCADRWYAP